MIVPIEISARHIHLSESHLYELFGKNYELTVYKKISQPDQFSANETVTIKNGENTIENVRIVGPVRNETQLEISKTDARRMGIDAPVRLSGDIENTPSCIVMGPKGEINIGKGVIIAKRHLHISEFDAKKFNLKNNDIISIKISGERALTFDYVIVRSRAKQDELAFHIDTDEANAGDIKTGDFGEII